MRGLGVVWGRGRQGGGGLELNILVAGFTGQELATFHLYCKHFSSLLVNAVILDLELKSTI